MNGSVSLAPRRQDNWDWRAAANFICGGSGGGLLLWTACAAPGGTDLRGFVLAALALIGIGLICVWLELGRPWRAINVLRHGASSWMTREAIVATLLFCCGAVALVNLDQALALRATGGLGLVFLYCQARILAANKGIPAWRHRRCLPLVLATGLAEGAGLLTALAWIEPATTTPVAALLIVSTAARLVAWRRYLIAMSSEGSPVGALAALRAIDRGLIWAGSAAPIALAVVAAAVAQPVLVVLAGGMIAVAGAWLKYTLICRASFTQGFALPKTPVRGAGVSVPGVKPGWQSARPELVDRA